MYRDAGMERTAWTDERLDDLSRRMDAGFERVDRDIRDLRDRDARGFADVRTEFADVRMEMRAVHNVRSADLPLRRRDDGHASAARSSLLSLRGG